VPVSFPKVKTVPKADDRDGTVKRHIRRALLSETCPFPAALNAILPELITHSATACQRAFRD
jgi:hypothetical protein